jgi:cellulose synthase/poly-beta-1,6-N-acetylglucosamine synthase-like glycosyltransferase
MRRFVFWASAATLAYVYAGFPALVFLRGRFLRRPYVSADVTPSVGVVVAARNEQGVIGRRVENLLALDYPQNRLEIVVASDGSDDETNRIVRGFENERVRLVALPRVGKAEALNAAVEVARGEVLVFSDANTIFRSDALRHIVRPLADPSVGGVAGNQVYVGVDAASGDSSVIGEKDYWNFDRALKSAQSSAGSVTGATGAIYAIRRELFEPLRDDVNDDLLNSLRVVARGRRLVFAPDAIAYERIPGTASITFSRRVRIIVRGLRCVIAMRVLLDPRRYGFFSLQLFTHKVLLRVAVVPLVVLAGTSGLLLRSGAVYRVAAAGQASLYGLGLAGILLDKSAVGRRRILALPAYFCLVNAASARALWQLALGETQARWDPARSNEPPGDSCNHPDA